MATGHSEYNALSGRSVERLQALADGVFAVAMTLLVLDLRLPQEVRAATNHELGSQLRDLGPQFAAYLLSFTMLGTFWLAHHTVLGLCRTSDRMLAWAVLFYLFFVSTLPFTASVLAAHVDLGLAVALYWANLAGLGATLWWQVGHATRAGLTNQLASMKSVRRRLIVAQAMYAVAALVALINAPGSLAALAAVQVLFIISPRLPVRF